MSEGAADVLVSAEVLDMLRTCRTCGIAKPLADFKSHARKSDGTRYGYSADCRKCENAKVRDRYHRNKSTRLAEVLPLGEFATQVCRTCKQVLPFDQFGRNVAKRAALEKDCKKCKSEKAREWTTANSDKAYNAHLMRRFGITLAEYGVILASQGGVCAICGEPPDGPRNMRKGGRNVFKARLVVDHNHATGRVRGLLCGNCNTGIGHLKDDAATVTMALRYLERGGRP